MMTGAAQATTTGTMAAVRTMVPSGSRRVTTTRNEGAEVLVTHPRIAPQATQDMNRETKTMQQVRLKVLLQGHPMIMAVVAGAAMQQKSAPRWILNGVTVSAWHKVQQLIQERSTIPSTELVRHFTSTTTTTTTTTIITTTTTTTMRKTTKYKRFLNYFCALDSPLDLNDG